jgi:hypothetical protein
MAVIQLGGLISKIKGSIGGTAFKTQKSTQVMFRKSAGYSKNKLLLNNAIQFARWIFTQWGSLTAEQKNSWNSLAAILFFTDKFGNSVHISGRQLYTKTNINLRNIEYYEEASPSFSTLLPLVTVSNALFDANSKLAALNVTRTSDQPVYLMISAQVSQNNLPQPVFSRREAFFIVLNSSSTVLNFGEELFKKFPYLTNNYNVRYYIDLVNIYGIKGSPLYIDAVSGSIDYTFELEPYGVNYNWNVNLQVIQNLPTGTVYKSYYQTSSTAMPEPDFSSAVLFDTQGISNISSLFYGIDLNLLPPNLRYGNYVRVWVQPILPDTTVLDAKTQIWISKPIPAYTFLMVSGQQNASNDIVLTVNENFPPATTVRASFQVGASVYPTLNFHEATYFGEFDLGDDGTVNLGDVLFLPPFSLDPSSKIIVWIRPRNSGVDIDTALPQEIEAVEPVSGYDVTSALFVSISGGSPVSVVEILNNPTMISLTDFEEFQYAAICDSWGVGAQYPDFNTVTITGSLFGTLLAKDIFVDSGFDEELKACLFGGLKTEYRVNQNISCLFQTIPLLI